MSDLTLFRYFEAHLAVKAELVKQSLHSDGGTVVPQQPFYKVRNDYHHHHPVCAELFDGSWKKESCVRPCVLLLFPGVLVHQRAGYRDDGVPDRVWTSASLGGGGGFLQTVLCPFNAAAHISSLRLEDVLRQVKSLKISQNDPSVVCFSA